jgi:hypothetical protein
VTKKALRGQYIKTGEPLFEMGDLSRLWFHAEVYERDLPDIRLGQKAILRTPTVPGREFEGVVTFIDPNFDPKTRSTKVRIEVDNPPAKGDTRGLPRVLPHRAYAEADIIARIVFADWSGRSPQEVEDQVTYPLSTNLQGLAGVKEVRASSMFGFSLLTVVFDDKIDNYFARTRVLERLSFLQTLLPEGVTPQLGPDATGLGWVYQYYLKADPVKSSGTGPDAASGGFDLGTLRSLQNFFLRYQLAAVEGVPKWPASGALSGSIK